ncbi:MAG: hypothetical protein AAF480_04155 [Actinomycetota bacterium]
MAARSRLVPLLLAILLAGACAADTTVAVEVVTPTPGGEPADETPTEAPAPTEEPTAEEPEPDPDPDPTATPEPDPDPTATPEPEIPGEPFDFLVPLDGEVVGVVGVAFDDILELHELPGENTPLIGELPNLADDAVGTGEGRQLPASIWWKIRWNGLEGWVGSGFMARIGATVDFTNDLIQLNGNSDPGGAETLLEFGQLIAGIVASEEPPSRIVVAVPPDTSGDLGEITMDVVNLGDDALKGYRLHIFAEPAEIADAGWLLNSVEATLLCSRGVTEDGLCT